MASAQDFGSSSLHKDALAEWDAALEEIMNGVEDPASDDFGITLKGKARVKQQQRRQRARARKRQEREALHEMGMETAVSIDTIDLASRNKLGSLKSNLHFLFGLYDFDKPESHVQVLTPEDWTSLLNDSKSVQIAEDEIFFWQAITTELVAEKTAAHLDNEVSFLEKQTRVLPELMSILKACNQDPANTEALADLALTKLTYVAKLLPRLIHATRTRRDRLVQRLHPVRQTKADLERNQKRYTAESVALRERIVLTRFVPGTPTSSRADHVEEVAEEALAQIDTLATSVEEALGRYEDALRSAGLKCMLWLSGIDAAD